jgi:hypothetical protein
LWIYKIFVINFKYAPTNKHTNPFILIAVFVFVVAIMIMIIIVVNLLWSPELGQRVVLPMFLKIAVSISTSVLNMKTQSSSDESMPNQYQATSYHNTHGHSMNLHPGGNFK